MSSATYWLATETSEHSQVLSLENWSQVPVLFYACSTNWGIKWTSDSLGCSEWYQWDADVKLEAYFTVGVQSAFHSIQSVLEMILVRKCWQYYLHVPEDGHTDVTSLDDAFSSPTWQNVLIQVQIQDWLSKLAWKKNRITNLKVFIISGPSFHCALAGCQGSGGKAPSAQWQVSGLNISQNTSNVSHFLSSFQTVSS